MAGNIVASTCRIAQLSSPRLQLLQKRSTNSLEASIGRHIIQRDLARLCYRSDSNDRLVIACSDKHLIVRVRDPGANVFWCFVGEPTIKNSRSF